MYYSDEYAVVDAKGLVHAYPRALCLRSKDGDKRSVRFEETRNRLPLPVGLVVCGKYLAGSSWKPRPLSAAQAVLALLENTVRARHDPESAIRVLGKSVGNCRAVQSLRPEAARVARQVLKLIETVGGSKCTHLPERKISLSKELPMKQLFTTGIVRKLTP